MTHAAPDTSTSAGILRLGNMFCDAKALLTGVELDLFTTLRDHPATAGELREKLGLHGRGLSDWLELLVQLGLLRRDGELYRNGTGADHYLVRGENSYIGGFLERTNHNLYPAWGKLSTALRTGAPQSVGDFQAVLDNPVILRQFINSMEALTNVLAPVFIDAYDGWAGYRSVLDIGGCSGNVAMRIVEKHPNLSGAVFDLPQLATFFDEQAAERGLVGKVRFHGGDFFTDDLPATDVAILGHVLHDWSSEQRKVLVEKAFRSVNPGGVLLVYDRMLQQESHLVENLVISLDMLLVTEGGSEYPAAEVGEFAAAAGFDSIETRPLGEYDTLVVCHKPA